MPLNLRQLTEDDFRPRPVYTPSQGEPYPTEYTPGKQPDIYTAGMDPLTEILKALIPLILNSPGTAPPKPQPKKQEAPLKPGDDLRDPSVQIPSTNPQQPQVPQPTNYPTAPVPGPTGGMLLPGGMYAGFPYGAQAPSHWPGVDGSQRQGLGSGFVRG